MPIFDFRCANGHVSELIRPRDIRTTECGCGLIAARTGVNRGIGIVGPTTDTRGMFRRFQEASADADYVASKIEQQTGQPVQTPSLWQVAKARAAAINAAGENPYPKQST